MNGIRDQGIDSASFSARAASAGAVGAPWFVQFWPLFILFLMIASIAGSLATVVIAYRHADEDVRQAAAIEESRR